MKCFRDQTLVLSCSHLGWYMMNVYHIIPNPNGLWSLSQRAMAGMGPTGPCWGYSQQSRSQASNCVNRVLTPPPTENTNHWLRDRHYWFIYKKYDMFVRNLECWQILQPSTTKLLWAFHSPKCFQVVASTSVAGTARGPVGPMGLTVSSIGNLGP